ncbi:MAG: FG-GAP repeat domain-containing protein [Tepidisphaerales bacterium]
MPAKQFEDVSVAVGLGPTGLGSNVKGDRLLVADFNGDGRPDIIYCAGNGMLLLNTPQGFVESKDHGLNFKTGHIAPAIGDFIGDKTIGLFVPQAGGCKLYRSDGKGHFADVTAQSGDLAKFNGIGTSALFANFYGTGRQDLIVGCVRGYNRIYRNNGNGTFTDTTDEAGLSQRVFNTRGIAAFDMNKDGVLDLGFNNEGQESCVLVGSPARVKK